jgi:hypothetical protein
MTTLAAISWAPVGLPILVIVILMLAVIAFALYKKDYVKASVWARSCGFLLEAQNEGVGKTVERRPTSRKKRPQLS